MSVIITRAITGDDTSPVDRDVAFGVRVQPSKPPRPESNDA